MSGADQHIQLLTKMLSIPAISREEGPRADLFEQYMQKAGIGYRRQGNNLIVGGDHRDDSLKTLLLNSHIDTVPPNEDWDMNPFEPQVDHEKIIGLGSNDAGASVVSMLRAYELLREEVREKINLLLVLSAEEEVSGVNGITSLVSLLGRIDGAIVGEPTGMQPAVAERGLMVIDAEVRGRSGHAARNEGENAIYKAMDDLRRIRETRFEERSEWLPDPSAQVTMIEAGMKHNVVPERCRYVIDVRSNDRYSNEQMLEILQKVCNGTLVPRSMRLRTSSLPGDHFLFRAIRNFAGMKPFGSLTLSDMALIPYPAVKMGPGDSGRSHTANEYIYLDEIRKGTEMYVSFIRSVITQLKA
jgi:acetylornithine deacetylase